jgi:hypothetical protein
MPYFMGVVSGGLVTGELVGAGSGGLLTEIGDSGIQICNLQSSVGNLECCYVSHRVTAR